LLLPAFVLAARAGFRLLTMRVGRAAGRESFREVELGLPVVLEPLEYTFRWFPFRGVQAGVEDFEECVPEEGGRAAGLLLPLEPFPLAELAPVRRSGRLLEDDCVGLRSRE
jgi:hypothetical protein